MHRQTRMHQFTKKEKERIYDRDQGTCIFCALGYHMDCKSPMLYQILDYMHYINKSAGGLGIEQNAAIGCRYHHGLLDNGHLGLRQEMLDIFKKHLQDHYPGWDPEKLVYQKYT